ncbi:SSX2IP [Bugula neritina]|uniref:SSX2IP n=1 Tax=Bugula neritina TaxID=10212 RepID=A0A7J7IU09_BUGNE|nr:SSX2IP [Bugula neritina]
MENDDVALGPYLKMISPSRTGMILRERLISSQIALNGEAEKEFCCKANLNESIQYLDKECQVLGLSGLYNSSGSFDVTKLVNVAHNLLRKCQQSSRYREELESRVHQSSTELEHNQNSQKRLRQSINSLQNTVAKLEEQERQLRIENSNVHLKFKAQLNETKKLKSLMQSTENQYKHEVKKLERQMTTIKERAQLLLTDKAKASHVPNMEITACLNRTDTRRSKWRNDTSNMR